MLYSGIFRKRDRGLWLKKSCGQTLSFGKDSYPFNGDAYNGKSCKRRRFYNRIKFAILIIFVIFCYFNIPKCYAETTSTDGLSEAIDEIIDGLDLSELENVYDDLNLSGTFDPREKIRAYLSGRTEFEFADIIKVLIDLVTGSLSDHIPEMLAMICVVIFGCVIESLSAGGGGVGKFGTFAVNAMLSVMAASLLFSVFSVTKDAVQSLSKQIQAVFPVILTLMTAAGGGGSVAVFRPTVAYICSLESVIANNVLLPIVVLLFVFGVVGNLSSTVKLDKMTDFLKSLFKWIVGVVTMVFTFFVTAQGITSSSFDGFSVKALKYMVGNGVPLVSQLVNGGFDVVFASCVLVKNSLGLFAMTVLLVTLLSPIVKIAVLSLFIRFISACVQPVASAESVKLLSSVSDSINYLSAVLISVGVVYMITLFMSVCALGVAV